MFHDDLPRSKPQAHEIGMDLSLLSVADLQVRVTLLKDEILRLEESIAAKEASKSAADAFFKT